MNILLIGSGGREHALAWKLASSPLCSRLIAAPGNPGIAEHAECVSVQADDVEGLVALAQDRKIDFVVPGPEVPLVLGLADRLRAIGIPVFGPSQAAARLEGSKGFMKDLCAKYDIPTAAYARFTDVAKARAFIEKTGAPIVVKADGLAAGKGVVVAQSVEEACQAADSMLSAPGASIVVEQFLDGEEVSYFALTDGRTVLPFASAQDHKRVFDGDEGPNTGGMGAYSPAHLMTPYLEAKILERIVWPTVDAMAAEGCPFSGVLYAGVMVCNGEPYLLEYNVRFGDPECQPIMMRLDSDIVPVLLASAQGRLAEVKPSDLVWSYDPALCVVMAAKGYPGSYVRGGKITGIDAAQALSGVRVFHAGTARGADGALIAHGGRVLGGSARGETIARAQSRAYEAVDTIVWADGFCRRDIGWRAVAEQRDRAAARSGRGGA
ncbi:MAG: phosphoribosylamine--glycine ligase [Rhodospirillales bacterium]|nr:phosphoribosylamine--glycine ligase [Rhodospirillales bacterium]